MSETKKVWLVKFEEMDYSIYVIADDITTAMKKSIEIYNKSSMEIFSEEGTASIKFVCSAEE